MLLFCMYLMLGCFIAVGMLIDYAFRYILHILEMLNNKTPWYILIPKAIILPFGVFMFSIVVPLGYAYLELSYKNGDISLQEYVDKLKVLFLVGKFFYLPSELKNYKKTGNTIPEYAYSMMERIFQDKDRELMIHIMGKPLKHY